MIERMWNWQNCNQIFICETIHAHQDRRRCAQFAKFLKGLTYGALFKIWVMKTYLMWIWNCWRKTLGNGRKLARSHRKFKCSRPEVKWSEHSNQDVILCFRRIVFNQVSVFQTSHLQRRLWLRKEGKDGGGGWGCSVGRYSSIWPSCT